MQFFEYKETALEMGALHSAEFNINHIAFDPRVILKCMFGCADYGKLHTCPNQRSKLNQKEYEEIFRRYRGGIVIGTHDKKKSQDISYEIERKCFLDGFYFAFSLSDCAVCSECALSSHKECRSPKKARPAFHSVGIDVFKTVRNLGLPIDVLKDKNETVNWYSAVFID